MTDNECPQVQNSPIYPIYKGADGGSVFRVGEVYGNGTANVAFTVADSQGAADIEVDPEYALEIAAGITEAAHVALMRREMGW